MASFNRVILMGNLTRDPDLSTLPDQVSVVNLSLAVNRNWVGKDGQSREETCYIDCVAYGKTADVIHEHFSKGLPILVEGRLKLDTWKAKDGSKRSKHMVTVDRFAFVAPKDDAGDTDRPTPAPVAKDVNRPVRGEDIPY